MGGRPGDVVISATIRRRGNRWRRSTGSLRTIRGAVSFPLPDLLLKRTLQVLQPVADQHGLNGVLQSKRVQFKMTETGGAIPEVLESIGQVFNRRADAANVDVIEAPLVSLFSKQRMKSNAQASRLPPHRPHERRSLQSGNTFVHEIPTNSNWRTRRYG